LAEFAGQKYRELFYEEGASQIRLENYTFPCADSVIVGATESIWSCIGAKCFGSRTSEGVAFGHGRARALIGMDFAGRTKRSGLERIGGKKKAMLAGESKKERIRKKERQKL
jgi:hypothetical protein